MELIDVSVAYDGPPVLTGLSLRVFQGEWIGLIGPNGAGKTTMLRAIAGLVSYAGRVSLTDAAVSTLTRRRLSQLVAYEPQRPLIPTSMTVTDYLLMGRTPYISYLGTESRHDLQVVNEVLERLELAPFADRPLGSMSGGEVQRAVLGRALAQEAPLLLLDEPTAALDVGHQQQVLELIDELRFEHALTVISAVHDLTLVGQFADRLLLLSGGRVAAEGTARAVLTERAIAEHYGASVRILEGPDGSVLVIPMRSERRLAIAAEETRG
ncbi:MAG: ABC transporter ATP-binding protein [Actinomycetota bacterium]